MIKQLTGVYMDASKPAGTITQLKVSEQPLEIPRGEHVVLEVFVYRQNREVKDLTGLTLRLTLRDHPGDASHIWTKSVAPAGADALAGKAVFTLAYADTAHPSLVDHGRYVYDVQLIEAGNRWQAIPPSLFRVTPIVNRTTES